jgi:ribosomal protein S18 acetylase RimI-like enzyme
MRDMERTHLSAQVVENRARQSQTTAQLFAGYLRTRVDRAYVDQIIPRTFLRDDGVKLFSLWGSLYRESFSVQNFWTVNEEPDLTETVRWGAKLDERMRMGKAAAKVAEAENNMVGFCYVTDEYSKNKEPFLTIHVREGFRHKGLGRRLMEATIEDCRGIFDAIKLSVLPKNKNAKELYLKLGFVDIGMNDTGKYERMKLELRRS